MISVSGCVSVSVALGSLYLSSSLWDEEVREEECNQAEGSEEDVCAPFDCLEHVRRHKANDEVAHPCRRCGDRDGLGTDGQVEDLRWKNPSDRRYSN